MALIGSLICKRRLFTPFNWYFVKPLYPYTPKIRFVHRQVNEKLQKILKDRDVVSDDYKIVYRAPLLYYVKVTYSCAVFSSIFFVFLISKTAFFHDTRTYPLMLNNLELIQSPLDLLGFSFCLFLVMLQVYFVVFKYPLRIYNNPMTGHYIVIYQHLLPWKNQKEVFEAGELKKVENSWMPWHDALYKFKDRKAILIETHFQRPIDLELMMKPIAKKEA